MDENLTLTGQKRIFYQAFYSIAFPLKYAVKPFMALFYTTFDLYGDSKLKEWLCILLNKMMNRQELENESFMKELQNICS